MEPITCCLCFIFFFILHPSPFTLFPMRLPTFFLLCLLLLAAYNAVLAARRQFQLRALPPVLTETHPAEIFAARLDAVTDPVELRRLTLARYRSLLASDQTVHNLLVTLRTSSRIDFAQSGIIFLLASGIYFSGQHSFRREDSR